MASEDPPKSPSANSSQPDPETSGLFEVEMFPAEVDSVDHPYAAQFKEMLEEVALSYNCRLLRFDVHKGTTTFAFDSDALNAEVARILQRDKDR